MILTSIISLGSHCDPAIQYRRFFQSEPYSPFDWLITCPLDTLFKIISNDGEHFGDEVTSAMDGTSALCTKYGCYYHHEFERNDLGKMLFSQQSLKNCKEKLQYKYRKCFEIAGKTNPLFIRWANDSEIPSNSDRFLYTYEEVNLLVNTLEKRIGHNNFHLAFIGIKNSHGFDLIDPSALGAIPNVSADVYEAGDLEPLINFGMIFFIRQGFAKNNPPII